ncbi:MAG: DMT family transporter [Candidatus Anstonellaceae archaeon]
MEKTNGIALAYLTALVSGISVFANSIGVVTMDSTAYTFLKNLLVAAILAAIGLSAGKWKEIASLNRKQSLMLLFVGIVGGGAAFALYFAGLAATGGAVGSFLYRLLFVFATFIAIGWLKEKFSWQTAVGALAILAGNYLLLGSAAVSLGWGVALVLAATILWACEYAVSKKVLEGVSATTVAAARMGIGAIVLLAILVWQGKIGAVAALKPESLMWIAISTGLLTLFVTLWYSSLKRASLISATAALTLGGPISALLSLIFAGKALAPLQAGGFLLLALGAVFAVGAGETVAAISWARKTLLLRLRL